MTAGDAERLDRRGLARGLVDREVEAAGQRRDLAPHALAGHDEQRVDQAVRRSAAVSRTMRRRRSELRSRRGRSAGKGI
jgi:hypothetical protein